MLLFPWLLPIPNLPISLKLPTASSVEENYYSVTENLKLNSTSGIIPCYDCFLQNTGMQSPIEAVARWLLLQHLVLVKLIVCCGSKGTVATAIWERVQLYPHFTIFLWEFIAHNWPSHSLVLVFPCLFLKKPSCSTNYHQTILSSIMSSFDFVDGSWNC